MGCTYSSSASPGVNPHNKPATSKTSIGKSSATCSESDVVAEEHQRQFHKHGLSGDQMVVEKRRDYHEDYEVLEQIGQGRIGKVFTVTKKWDSLREGTLSMRAFEKQLKDKKNNVPVDEQEAESSPVFALKEIDMDQVVSDSVKEMKNEIEILRNVDHPNIVKAFEVYYNFGRKSSVLSVVMEFCSGGDLNTRAPYTEDQAKTIITQLVGALNYLHSKNIMHCDLNPENILFEDDSRDAQVKLIDFGLSKRYAISSRFASAMDLLAAEASTGGSIYTMAPEVVLEGARSQAADMWSVGVITYQLLSGGRNPFWSKSSMESMSNLVEIPDKLVHGEYDFPREEWSKISLEAQDFIRNLLFVDPNLRYTASEATTTPWIGGGSDVEETEESTSKVNKLDDQVYRAMSESFSTKSDQGEFRRLIMQSVAHRASSKQVLEQREAFKKVDVNMDGTITVEEMKKKLGGHFQGQQIEEWFEKADVDASGTLDYREFIAAASFAGTCVDERIDLTQVAAGFETFDREGKGFITRENLSDILGVLEDDGYVEQLVREADTNGDGLISFTEFKNVALGMSDAKQIPGQDSAQSPTAGSPPGQ